MNGTGRSNQPEGSFLQTRAQSLSDIKDIFPGISNENFPPYPAHLSLVDCIPTVDPIDHIRFSRAGSTTPSDEHIPSMTDGGKWMGTSDSFQCFSSNNKREATETARALSESSSPQGVGKKEQYPAKRRDPPEVGTPKAVQKESRFAKYRERNREAARRSREKQRELAESLESKAAALEYKRDALLEEVEILKCNVQELSQGVRALHRLARSPRTSLHQPTTSPSVCIYCGGLCAPYGY
ncbi:hypothetical protein BDV28DRAFT_126124 [Aspergillus coremiiformis]|uniref:BZIP domain-containing protein n=1 Tax=Aspergillus coremiiformis TaxID=138285 RepID=A0A5N6ZIJ1_9EURO|nr:hypothetical protein BDV28DRAFT_126124 [Aspergillus coremiiformis]